MEKKIDQRRTNLHKIYKHVRKCRLCNKKYGTDKNIKENGMCSACSRKYIQLSMREKKLKNKLKGGIKNGKEIEN